MQYELQRGKTIITGCNIANKIKNNQERDTQQREELQNNYKETSNINKMMQYELQRDKTTIKGCQMTNTIRKETHINHKGCKTTTKRNQTPTNGCNINYRDKT